MKLVEFRLLYVFKSANVIIRNHGLRNNEYLKMLREYARLHLMAEKTAGRIDALPGDAYPVGLRFLWESKTRIRMDLDNLDFSRKAIVDGMIDAGILANDTVRQVAAYDARCREKGSIDGVHVVVYSLHDTGDAQTTQSPLRRLPKQRRAAKSRKQSGRAGSDSGQTSQNSSRRRNRLDQGQRAGYRRTGGNAQAGRPS